MWWLAAILQVFDSNAGELPPHQLKEFSLPYLARIAEGVKARLAADGVEAVPLVVFARGAMHSLDLVAKLGYDVLGIDWTIDLKSARAKAGPGCVLQGNLDPCTLFAPPEVIRQEVRRMLADNGDGSLIANLGHGMLPNHSPEHLGVFIEEIHAVSRAAKST
ncbi:uroporphyrinogen decarboxylase [Fonticula alba]|uniref:Uroporphyrinogen decarboxylase n=1 Tax=Fonticula alba TaxID=691883 RepID=A0A058Z432_FONAL|nr:uroporphyrinogen decarboxylase [Fonticula alba]KCV68995.1 uroporphyrinogen decarboxylase [Fonticula alba]|eukprot:XP_009496566.1 uroporphyrinogen decarboxylase [Fonticula alba]